MGAPPEGRGPCKGVHLDSVGCKGKGRTPTDWRRKTAEVAAAKSDGANILGIWKDLRVTSLPPGPLNAPRWDTAFAAAVPQEGSTQSVLFVATLAGAYCVKASANPAEEYFANRFLQRCGVEVPALRVVFGTEEEHAAIMAAIRQVAHLAKHRGDPCLCGQLRSMLRHGLRKPQVFVMEFIRDAVTVGDLVGQTSVLDDLFAFPTGACERDKEAASRLQALGRCWFGDTLLCFRDRFAHHPLVSPSHFDSQERLTCRVWCALNAASSNGDNILVRRASGSTLVFIDSHSKCVKVSRDASQQDWPHRHYREFIASACKEVEQVHLAAPCMTFMSVFLRSVTGGVEGDQELVEEWMQFSRDRQKAVPVEEEGGASRSKTLQEEFRAAVDTRDGGHHFRDIGYSLSDAALCEVRTGFLCLLREITANNLEGDPEDRHDGREMLPPTSGSSAFSRWVREELAALHHDGGGQNSFWDENARRIDGETLQGVLSTLQVVAEEHKETLEKVSPVTVVFASAEEISEPNVVFEATEVGASPSLWAALPDSVRALLRAEMEAARA